MGVIQVTNQVENIYEKITDILWSGGLMGTLNPLIMKYRNLKVYQMAFNLAVKIHELTMNFPREEKYSLIDQVRRSSRSVCANIAEGYRKRRYPKHFINKLSDADSENSETMVWLEFSEIFKYLSEELFKELSTECAEIGYLLNYMINNPSKYL